MGTMYSDALEHTASAGKWGRIGARKRAGVLVPLFSVYSKHSVGIGDFNDMKLLVDWCVKTDNSILQLLPMNEVGPTFCPYDAISSFAIEPAYIALESIPATKKKNFKDRIADIRKKFPAGKSHVDYGVRDEKIRLLRDMYKHDGCEEKEFKHFSNVNDYWLEDYALFKALKAHHADAYWYQWGDFYKNRDQQALEDFRKENRKELDFHKWVQWIVYNQFKDVRQYAQSKNILIKGDLPILISRDSADVWAHQGFFKLDYAAGAPPDMYCSKGQRWGMPTYEWGRIAEDDYRFHKEKLKYAQEFYDIIRVDHVVGLFRIWSIANSDPLENEGLGGFFDPSNEGEWEGHGRNILSMMLNNTSMLLCAEDLGMIPPSCPSTLKQFGIPGNEVQRWVKDWDNRHDFLWPDEYRLMAVSMLSTHDTTNWAGWWENEAGTVDEALFMRKTREYGIDYERAKRLLFDPERSRHGRLRWLESVNSEDILTNALGKNRDEVWEFINLYRNTYLEKEKLWRQLNIKGPMREKASSEIVNAALKITLGSRSVFCIELLVDYLYMADIMKGDPYAYRLNRPGTISKENWSLTLPIALEDLLEHKVCKKIKEMIVAADRA